MTSIKKSSYQIPLEVYLPYRFTSGCPKVLVIKEKINVRYFFFLITVHLQEVEPIFLSPQVPVVNESDWTDFSMQALMIFILLQQCLLNV